MEKSFRILGWLEGVSFLALIALAMPLKYYFQIPAGVKILGPVHGMLFVFYCALAFLCALNFDWPIKKHLLAYAAAVFPFGTFIFDRFFLTNHSPAPQKS